MPEQERDRPAESLGQAPGDESFGNAPSGGTGTFGEAPAGQGSTGNEPRRSGRNVPLLVGGGVAVLAILAAIFGFLVK